MILMSKSKNLKYSVLTLM